MSARCGVGRAVGRSVGILSNNPRKGFEITHEIDGGDWLGGTRRPSPSHSLLGDWHGALSLYLVSLDLLT